MMEVGWESENDLRFLPWELKGWAELSHSKEHDGIKDQQQV